MFTASIFNLCPGMEVDYEVYNGDLSVIAVRIGDHDVTETLEAFGFQWSRFEHAVRGALEEIREEIEADNAADAAWGGL